MDSNEQVDVELRRKDEQIRLRYVDIQSLHARIDKLTKEKRKAVFDLEQVYGSFSWRAGGLLRAIRYLMWTMPNLVFQWTQRIFLDKGLITKTELKLEKKNEARKNEARKNEAQKSQVRKNEQFSKKSTRKKNDFADHQNFPEQRRNLLLAEYETKYVVNSSSDNSIWNRASRKNSAHSGMKNYDLRNPGIFRRQAKLVSKIGIDGFCYHYDERAIGADFDGPIMNHYRNTDTQLCYCVCWSNESVPLEQFNLLEIFHLRKFIEYCERLFDDTRYVYYQHRPVIVIRGLSKQQVLLAKEVWLKWGEERNVVNPFVLSLDEDSQQSVVDLSTATDINLVRNQLSKTSSHKVLALSESNMDLAPSILNNIRRFSYQGEMTFLSSWNNWDTGYALESNDVSFEKIRFSIDRVRSSILPVNKEQITIAVTADLDPKLIDQIVGFARGMGIDPQLLLLDECKHEFPGISSTNLFGKSGVDFFNAILLRLEKDGCHLMLSFNNLSESLNEALVNSGWYVPLLEKKTELTKADLRECINVCGMVLPALSVICEVTDSTRIEQIKRFIVQIESQYLIPEEIVFAGNYQGELIASNSTLNVIYQKGSMLDIACKAESDLLWLTQIETMPSRNFLKVVSRKLGDNSAVIYPFDSVIGESAIRGRGDLDKSLYRKKTSLSQDDLMLENRLGQFSELVLRRSDLVKLLERCSPLQGVFEAQIDWILWLLVGQMGTIFKDSQSRTTSLAVRPIREVHNFKLDELITKSYLGSNTTDLSHLHKEDWADIKAKLILLDQVMKPRSS